MRTIHAYHRWRITQEQVDLLTGTNIRYYYNGLRLYEITVSVMGLEIVMIIEELSSKIPTNMFKVSEGHKEAAEVNHYCGLFGLC